jgi:hypothetical protein
LRGRGLVGDLDADDITSGDHDCAEVIVSSEVLSAMVGSLLRGKTCGRSVVQLLIVDIFELVVEGAVVGRVDLCHCLVQNEVSLVIHAHEPALEAALVLGGHPHPLADEFLLEGGLCWALIHLYLIKLIIIMTIQTNPSTLIFLKPFNIVLKISLVNVTVEKCISVFHSYPRLNSSKALSRSLIRLFAIASLSLSRTVSSQMILLTPVKI